MEEITNITVEGMTLEVDLDDGMLHVYTDGEYRGGVRVAEPAPVKPEEPPARRSLPEGWTFKNGVIYDENGAVLDPSA